MEEKWCSISGFEGQYEISTLGRVKSLCFKKEKISKPVGAFKNGVLIKRYKSATAASREDDNLNYISISAACHGRLKTYRGFIWRFL